jgi:amidase
MARMDILTLPATDLRDRLVRRDLSASDLLEATLERIARFNPAVNAIVAGHPDAARAAARESDRRLSAGDARPLEGLVITIKDSFDVADLTSTAGAPAFRNRVPDRDSAAVRRLREAGALILEK